MYAFDSTVYDFNASNKFSSTPAQVLNFQEFSKPSVYSNPLYITDSGNILACGDLCFRVFKRLLKVIGKNVCYLYSV